MENLLYGHHSVIEIFDTLFKKDMVPHGILLSGKKSTGKRKLARELAKKILTESISTEKKAKQSALIDQGQHPDLVLLQNEEGSKLIKVEQIRSLIEQLSLTSYYGAGIVAVINDAHTMNISAANTLLKTLEEPEAHKYIILISDSPQLLPETILSRCHHFSCPPLSESEVKHILQQLFAASLTESTLHTLSLHAKDSLSLLNLSSLIDERTLTLSRPRKGCRIAH
jgi:DNA polymerase III gamma/tau subunit